MATYIVDPRASSNGTGSAASPKNTYLGLTIASNDTVLQVATTTYAGTITVPVGATDVTIGCCDSSGIAIDDGSAFALVNATGQQYGIRVRETSHRYEIFGFEVYGANASTQNWAFYLGNTASQVADDGRLHHFIARDTDSDASADSGGVKFNGSGVEIADGLIYNMPTDAIFGQGNRARILRNSARNFDLDGRGFGDGVQLTGNATLGCGSALILGNDIDHSNSNSKQCINVQDTTGGSYGAVIAHNRCVMPLYDSAATNVIYVEAPDSIVIGNHLYGANYGIYLRLSNNRVYGNVVMSAGYGIYQNSSVTGAKIYNNTVTDASIAGIYAATDTTLEALNNILLDNLVGIAKVGGASEDFNCYFGNGSDQSNLGGAASWGSNNIFTDPLLDASYRPMAGSPCIGAGVYIAGVRDFSGRKLKRTPDIGARQYYASRGVVSPARTALAVLRDTPATLRSTRSGVLRVGR